MSKKNIIKLNEKYFSCNPINNNFENFENLSVIKAETDDKIQIDEPEDKIQFVESEDKMVESENTNTKSRKKTQKEVNENEKNMTQLQQ
jgi:hypothetical protein